MWEGRSRTSWWSGSNRMRSTCSSWLALVAVSESPSKAEVTPWTFRTSSHTRRFSRIQAGRATISLRRTTSSKTKTNLQLPSWKMRISKVSTTPSSRPTTTCLTKNSKSRTPPSARMTAPTPQAWSVVTTTMTWPSKSREFLTYSKTWTTLFKNHHRSTTRSRPVSPTRWTRLRTWPSSLSNRRKKKSSTFQRRRTKSLMLIHLKLPKCHQNRMKT